MKYVLDSSVAVSWLLPESFTAKAILLRNDFKDGVNELVAPDVMPIEVTHAVTRAERQRRISPAEGSVLLKEFLKTLPRLQVSLALLPKAYAISSSKRIGVYDSLYVALAEQEG